ncbi:MAG: recombinase family protein, partial [Pseudonocardiaceae bacterium]
RIEVAHACRSSDDTSRRLRDALEDRARDGRPHTSARRPYGYAADARTVIEAEALVVREMFARYLDGATPREIAETLNARGQPAAGGGLWHPGSVRRMLRSRHVTGIRVFRGEEFGEGDWPAIIDRGTWAEVADRLAYRASAHAYRSSRFYLLRGLVVCKKCGTHMSGSRGRAPSYLCTRRNELGPTRITTLHRKTIVRPTVEVLAGLVGPDARASWDRLAAEGQWQRLNAVLRFLFAAVIIDEHRGKSGTFDYSRIDIEANPL